MALMLTKTYQAFLAAGVPIKKLHAACLISTWQPR